MNLKLHKCHGMCNNQDEPQVRGPSLDLNCTFYPHKIQHFRLQSCFLVSTPLVHSTYERMPERSQHQ